MKAFEAIKFLGGLFCMAVSILLAGIFTEKAIHKSGLLEPDPPKKEAPKAQVSSPEPAADPRPAKVATRLHRYEGVGYGIDVYEPKSGWSVLPWTNESAELAGRAMIEAAQAQGDVEILPMVVEK